MRLLARKVNIFIYDDGDHWYNLNNALTPAQERFIPKVGRHQMYPLAACLKWGFEPVDVEALNALSDGGLAGYERYVKEHPAGR